MRGWVFLLTLFLVPPAIAGVGTWKNYTSMKNVTSIARDGDTYWAATSGGLFSWKETGDAYRLFTNADGLQEIDLTALGIDAQGNVWAGTSTGLIYVYSPTSGALRTIPDIAATTQPSKRINAFTMAGDTVLVCTDFGLSLFSVSRFEFGDTYSRFGSIPPSTRVSVRGAALFAGRLWASVTDGNSLNRVASASLGNPNLLPPDSWTLLTAGTGGGVPKDFATLSGKLLLGTSNGVYSFDGAAWASVAGFAGKQIVALATGRGKIAASTSAKEIFVLADPSGTPALFGNIPSFAPASLVFSAQNEPVAGSTGGGILRYAAAWLPHVPNGPNSNRFVSVAVDQRGTVWGASGPSSGEGFYRFDGTTWKSFTTSNCVLPVNEVYRITVGCDNSIWASTWGGGSIEIPGGSDSVSASHLYGRNVGMVGIAVNNNYIVTGNAACDGRGNLWTTVLMPVNMNAIAVRSSGGSWKTIPLIIGSTGAKVAELNWSTVDHSLALDAFDNVWVVVRDAAYKGVVGLMNGGRIDSVASVAVTADNGLPSNEISTLVVDRDNNIWVGTDKGIAIILDPQNPLRQGGIAAYKPLSGLGINSIAVDPLNQKWIGTTEGVIVLSPDGTQQVASYTVETTGGKLMDNDVKSVAVDPLTGTIYFGTEHGLASLTSAAAAPKLAFDVIKAYPNPFRVPTGKSLTIDGLVENSSVKILRVDGTLVRDLKTPGGRIGFWDGKDAAGNDVASGVYIIAAYSEDGSRVANGKVAVLKR